MILQANPMPLTIAHAIQIHLGGGSLKFISLICDSLFYKLNYFDVWLILFFSERQPVNN